MVMESQYSMVQIIKYMGSKKTIMNQLVPRIEELAAEGDAILDLFCGTCAISLALKQNHIIHANDNQHYAAEIAHALIGNNSPSEFSYEDNREFYQRYSDNRNELMKMLQPALDREKDFLAVRPSEENLEEFSDFVRSYPFVEREPQLGEYPEQFRKWFSPKNIERYYRQHDRMPYTLFSLYFANAYYGVTQAIDIDSLRYAISRVPSEGKRHLMVTALMAAMSSCLAGPGHFAQFPSVNNLKAMKHIVRYRKRNITQYFYEKVKEIEEALVDNSRMDGENKVFCLDYMDLLKNHPEALENVKVVYLDPPYSMANYSRFYHVLETMVLYDYPASEFTGRYRSDRHKSPFCNKGKLMRGFRDMFVELRKTDVKIALSYNHGSLGASQEALLDMITELFPKRRINVHDFYRRHSRMGNVARLEANEYMITID